MVRRCRRQSSPVAQQQPVAGDRPQDADRCRRAAVVVRVVHQHAMDRVGRVDQQVGAAEESGAPAHPPDTPPRSTCSSALVRIARRKREERTARCGGIGGCGGTNRCAALKRRSRMARRSHSPYWRANATDQYTRPPTAGSRSRGSETHEFEGRGLHRRVPTSIRRARRPTSRSRCCTPNVPRARWRMPA